MIKFAINNPKKVLWIMLGFMAICAAFIPMIQIDTDPENMLAEKEEVRVKHHELKKKFDMYDMVVVGVVNDQHPDGVFNQESLSDIYDLSRYVYELTYEDDQGNAAGVIQSDVMTPTNIDYISPEGDGRIKFDWVMNEAPTNDDQVREIKRRLMDNELYYNTVVSEDGKALALYLPISSKDQSYKIAGMIQDKIKSLGATNDYHITGLPVAEDTFGIEMFIQMAISAPAAMLLIFVLMLLFFKKLKLVLSPLIVAMVSVICTMGLLIATGNTVHIMSSMIPIFIMPIAVLDSVHILSEFYDRYQLTRDRKQTLQHVMSELYKPMLFTSLTSAAGFASLAMTPIPPVQVFGVFVAFGILLAWLVTMTFIPAYIMMSSEEALAGFGVHKDGAERSIIGKLLKGAQSLTYRSAGAVVLVLVAIAAICGYGVTKININDNPVKWFAPSHPIRVADQELNSHFGGTYMAYLNFDAVADNTPWSSADIISTVEGQLDALPEDHQDMLGLLINDFSPASGATSAYSQLSDIIMDAADELDESDPTYDQYEEIADRVSLLEIERQQVFKNPEVLNYLLGLEAYLQSEGGVGKSSSIAKIIKLVNKKLNNDQESFDKIPYDVSGVGQSILSFQNSHTPKMLWHFVSPDFRSANLWLQLKSGDNQDMEATIAAVDSYLERNPPPIALDKNWFGLTYINVVWQQKMVQGMMEAFLGSFLIVFLMMTFLFRSLKWGLLSMLPLTLTILIIYGVVGWIGKDYDMPVAVLSSLALGLAIDFAIHFLVRARESLRETGDWAVTSEHMFGEPGRAIVRNMIVIAIGFLPLLLATLIPYRTVGIILAAILFLSGVITLLLLPALIRLFRFKK